MLLRLIGVMDFTLISAHPVFKGENPTDVVIQANKTKKAFSVGVCLVACVWWRVFGHSLTNFFQTQYDDKNL